MNKLDKAYTDLLQDILDNGVTKQDRTGTGTISVFGRQIRHDMKDGFPLLTTKKMPFKTIVTELLWFLRGDTNIKFLVDNNCHIWDGDCYKNYIFNSEWTPVSTSNGNIIGKKSDSDETMTQEEFINKIKTDDEFANKWGELGPIYGKQWRSWGKTNYNTKKTQIRVTKVGSDGDSWKESQWVDEPYGFYLENIDQIQNLIDDLKTNPDSRRLMVNAWNVGELDQMVLPPCHYGFQVYTRELTYKERKNLCKISERVYPNGEWMDENNIPTRAISLMWNQRSVDTFLGLPFNIASYGLLLEIIAKEVNMVPDQLIGNLGDVHLYSNHIEQAKEQIGRDYTEEEIIEHLQKTGMDALKDEPRMEYIAKLHKRTREPFPLPTLKFNPCPITGISMEYLSIAQFEIENYQSHPTIKAPLSN